jgi:hypothetical protein
VSPALAYVLAGVLAAAPEAPSKQKAAAFRSACAARGRAAEKADAIAVIGKDGWMFLGKELRHLGVGKFWGPEARKVSRATKPGNADPLPAILDFKKQLDRAGVELLVVPVPPKAVVYPDKLFDSVQAGKGGPPRLDAEHHAFYGLLRRKGVKVLDLTADLTALRGGKAGEPYCKRDSHWSGTACALAARRIAADIQGRAWLKTFARRKLASATKHAAIKGDLVRDLKDDKDRSESLPLRFVSVRKSEELSPVEPERRSPVVLLGDSHNLVFHSGGDMLARGAGLPDQLAWELGLAVDLVAVRGSGATPARVNLLRLARASKDYLRGKKLVIWCFSAREFTESSGWQKVPIVK